MAHLIDKSAVVAEIESLLDIGKYHEVYDCAYRDGNNSALYALKGKIDALEVKDVDLEHLEQEELKEKRERFRLYGEICLLMEEQDEDIFDLLTVSRYGMPLEHEIVVRIENGDSGDFRGIQFEDGMLWVMFGSEQIAFVCVLSESLKEIYEALKNYLKEN